MYCRGIRGATTVDKNSKESIISASKELLEKIIVEAEMLELKANPGPDARGVVIEAKMEKGRGSVCTVLVQRGTLHVGDIFVVGQNYGRVRAMFDERNHAISEAPPSTPALILGFNGMPQKETDQRGRDGGRQVDKSKQRPPARAH